MLDSRESGLMFIPMISELQAWKLEFDDIEFLDSTGAADARLRQAFISNIDRLIVQCEFMSSRTRKRAVAKLRSTRAQSF